MNWYNNRNDLSLNNENAKENFDNLISLYDDNTPVEELKILVNGRNELSIGYLIEAAKRNGKITLAKNIREAARFRNM